MNQTRILLSPVQKKYTLEQLSKNIFSVYSYDNELEYYFYGTSKEAKISYVNEKSLPYWMVYKNFFVNKYGSDIKNLGEEAGVTIMVFFRGKLLREVSAPWKAPTSGNINVNMP